MVENSELPKLQHHSVGGELARFTHAPCTAAIEGGFPRAHLRKYDQPLSKRSSLCVGLKVVVRVPFSRRWQYGIHRRVHKICGSAHRKDVYAYFPSRCSLHGGHAHFVRWPGQFDQSNPTVCFHLHVIIKNAVKIDYGNRDSTDKLWVIELGTSVACNLP